MKLKTIGVSVVMAAIFSAGMAMAQMQPIPNPPEKPKAMKMHHKKAKKPMASHAAKPADAPMATAGAAPAKK